ncbi:putative Ras GTPase-activating protein-binding protein [Helianthus annuus]|nr:putative Ras GTPase-activating protein-binding protein [Helianthus annuus]
MASSHSSSVTVSKVGSKFVQHYYEVLQRQPELAHRFYTASSTIIRVDGESTQSASDISQIQTLVESLHLSEIEIKTVNSVGSWSGGITVVVSGSVKSDSFSGRRKFVQTFSLALVQPFSHAIVMNDIFHYVSDEDLSGVIYEKDVTDIFNIKRNDSETVEDFTSRFTKESSQIPQASDDIKNQLVKNLKLNDPKTFKDMIYQVRGFVRGETACALLKDADTQKPARAMRPKKRKRNRGSRRAAWFRGSRRNTFSPYHPMRQDHSSQIMDGTTLRTNGFQEGPLVVTLQCPAIVSGFVSFDVRDTSIGG